MTFNRGTLLGGSTSGNIGMPFAIFPTFGLRFTFVVLMARPRSFAPVLVFRRIVGRTVVFVDVNEGMLLLLFIFLSGVEFSRTLFHY